jgi:hypothetical protein
MKKKTKATLIRQFGFWEGKVEPHVWFCDYHIPEFMARKLARLAFRSRNNHAKIAWQDRVGFGCHYHYYVSHFGMIKVGCSLFPWSVVYRYGHRWGWFKGLKGY